MNTANWNLEAHSAQKVASQWQLGALFSIPGGKSVVVGGKIPYLPEALKKREEERAQWPKSDPETLCYLPGIPRATYMPYPFQIVQGNRDIFMVYTYGAANRTIHLGKHEEPPVDSWMGRSEGRWEGDTLVVVTTGFNGRARLDRAGNHFSAALKVTERFKLENPNVIRYEATLEDPQTYSAPWTIRMPSTSTWKRTRRSSSSSACRSWKSCSTKIWNYRRSAELSSLIGDQVHVETRNAHRRRAGGLARPAARG